MSAPTLARHHTAPRVRPFPGAPDTAPTVVLAPLTAACTPRLGRRALLHEHRATLATPRRPYGPVARLLFVTMDLLYGRRGTLEKFMVLEVVARIPYQIWENAAYRALGRRHRDAGLAHRIAARIEENREQQDNEQWHLLILSELVAARGGDRSWFRFRLLPWVMAASYYHLSWLLHVLAPRWAYRLNADFEDHAEHTYAEFVAEHPELEAVPHRSAFAARYGAHGSVADLLRQISHDERMHKLESERYLDEAPLR
ncbi:hypothetical protein I4I73_28755 [Pseudonocardia sp. KRD-184]|uniref:Alternative oxidase n=3 Tax=Pseudonocardia oceani TaxID=2792013 RepID=A0ABS6UCQ0_9PSEU|nr:alternative oxidase [Pseudonocardia oceani]MBW0099976.1 hypothetical protein [Pseudonocardia oceani]MBW0119937.1 hypothetical protein [Pseudonocardia oceani]MBW0130017.1 hypothetical protein [Pseudonocardia oceani]